MKLGTEQRALLAYLREQRVTESSPEWVKNVALDLDWTQGKVRRVAASLANRGLVDGAVAPMGGGIRGAIWLTAEATPEQTP